MITNKIIFGFVGQIASGKGAATNHLKEKYEAKSYRFSTMLRDVVDRIYIEQNRENLQKISRVLRENFGEDVMARVMSEDVKNNNSKFIVIDGIRRPSDVAYLKDVPGFVLISIEADIEKRYERIVKRGENPDETNKTMEEFKEDSRRESELKIDEIAEQAHERIDNNGLLDDLYKQLDELVEKYGN